MPEKPAGKIFLETNQREAMLNLERLLWEIGSANDAEDHMYHAEAERIRAEACQSIERVLDDNPDMDTLIPSLRQEIASGRIWGIGWNDLAQLIRQFLGYRFCRSCSSLADQEYARQKFGWEENDTHLPAAAGLLETVKDLGSSGSRTRLLQRCPECGTYYLYRTDYDYLVNGTEDEQYLSRLTESQAESCLNSEEI